MAEKAQFVVLVEAELDEESDAEVDQEAIRSAIIEDIEDIELYPTDEDNEIVDGDAVYVARALGARGRGA
jgi:hypothetical protein